MVKNSFGKIPTWTWALLCVFLGIALLFILSTKQEKASKPDTNKPAGYKYEVKNIRIGNKTTIQSEVADTQEKTTLGLSYRESLPKSHGMLFIFSNPHIPTFWMKGMNFPLDMIWIGENNTIVDITENIPAPAPGILEINLPHYSPKVPAKMVLEVNAGFVEENRIEVGDYVQLEVRN